MMPKSPKIKYYVQGILTAAAIIGPLGLFQLYFVYNEFHPRLIVIPLLVIIIIGSLFGSILWMRRDLKMQGDLFKAIADFALEFSYVQNNQGEYIYVSPASIEITGHGNEDFYSNPNFMDKLIHRDDLPEWKKMQDDIRNSKQILVRDLRIVTGDRGVRWIRHHAGPVLDQRGNVTGIRATSFDISLHKQNEEQIRNLADYDVLTGLPNRRFIHQHLTQLIQEANATGENFAVIFMDLDRFKFVNDAHGHSMGDILLAQVSTRLKDVCAKGCSLIGRFGGDEFVILLTSGANKDAIMEKCRELIRAANEPFNHEGMRFSLGASLGVAIYPHDGEDAESLVKNADAAMYHAKRKLEDSIHFFSAEIGKTVSKTFHFESQLRKAIDENRLEVHYQPIIDLRTGQVSAVEALARWRLEDGSSIPPSTFIQLAEDMGRIHVLDARIAEKACRQLRIWLNDGINIKLSVNISARRFQHNNFCNDMFRIISENGIDPSLLKLEITESALIENIESSREKIKIMRHANAEVAIDDFGTGFSSLGYLTSLPINILKIDRSFISVLTFARRNQAVVEGILSLARSLEISVIAEGIETEEQHNLLKNMGCGSGQGYLFAEPMSADDFTQYYKKLHG